MILFVCNGRDGDRDRGWPRFKRRSPNSQKRTAAHLYNHHSHDQQGRRVDIMSGLVWDKLNIVPPGLVCREERRHTIGCLDCQSE